MIPALLTRLSGGVGSVLIGMFRYTKPTLDLLKKNEQLLTHFARNFVQSLHAINATAAKAGRASLFTNIQLHQTLVSFAIRHEQGLTTLVASFSPLGVSLTGTGGGLAHNLGRGIGRDLLHLLKSSESPLNVLLTTVTKTLGKMRAPVVSKQITGKKPQAKLFEDCCELHPDLYKAVQGPQ